MPVSQLGPWRPPWPRTWPHGTAHSVRRRQRSLTVAQWLREPASRGLALIRTVRWIVSVIVATLICRLRISDEIREHPIPAGDVTPAVRNGDPMCCLGQTIRLEGAQFVVELIRHPSLLHNDECQVVEANTVGPRAFLGSTKRADLSCSVLWLPPVRGEWGVAWVYRKYTTRNRRDAACGPCRRWNARRLRLEQHLEETLDRWPDPDRQIPQNSSAGRLARERRRTPVASAKWALK